ncbi:hypothetical protein [Paractinoplanes brasiliensis]|uniref:hypothetical protein n=1 Tax=Paractinoplanes brasiliensis TaxID=52695 RepID=UPI001EF2FAB6|nr:hypothetical protein [Actinoplanes brasiliensis]
MTWLDQLLTAFYTAKWQVTADQAIYYREIVGNAFGPSCCTSATTPRQSCTPSTPRS